MVCVGLRFLINQISGIIPQQHYLCNQKLFKFNIHSFVFLPKLLAVAILASIFKALCAPWNIQHQTFSQSHFLSTRKTRSTVSNLTLLFHSTEYLFLNECLNPVLKWQKARLKSGSLITRQISKLMLHLCAGRFIHSPSHSHTFHCNLLCFGRSQSSIQHGAGLIRQLTE